MKSCAAFMIKKRLSERFNINRASTTGRPVPRTRVILVKGCDLDQSDGVEKLVPTVEQVWLFPSSPSARERSVTAWDRQFRKPVNAANGGPKLPLTGGVATAIVERSFELESNFLRYHGITAWPKHGSCCQLTTLRWSHERSRSFGTGSRQSWPLDFSMISLAGLREALPFV